MRSTHRDDRVPSRFLHHLAGGSVPWWRDDSWRYKVHPSTISRLAASATNGNGWFFGMAATSPKGPHGVTTG
jgi:hypothetical protein